MPQLMRRIPRRSPRSSGRSMVSSPRPGLALAMAAIALAVAALPATTMPDIARAEGVAPHPASLAGRLLIADRGMPDGRFAKTVIYMVEHDARGAMGVILNKPVRRMPADELASLLTANGDLADGVEPADIEIDIYNGGPVQKNALFVLHDGDWRDGPTLSAGDGLALSGSLGLLREILEGRGPDHFRVFFGYAGWGPQQLEGELKRDGWISAPGDPAFVFDRDPPSQWERAVEREDIPL